MEGARGLREPLCYTASLIAGPRGLAISVLAVIRPQNMGFFEIDAQDRSSIARGRFRCYTVEPYAKIFCHDLKGSY